MTKTPLTIFIYSDLRDDLRRQMQAGVEQYGNVFFSSELKTDAHAIFMKSNVVLGNPPLHWFDSPNAGLQFWQLDSAGFDQYRRLSTTAVVANMGDFFSRPCAETMVGGILAFYRKLNELAVLQDKRIWKGKPLRYEMDLLSGKQVVLLGAGTIAMSIKKMLLGFECQVKMTGRSSPSADITRHDDLLIELHQSDIVINTLPGSAGLFMTCELFDAMKKGSLYASVGRGSTTDENALIDVLQSGKLYGAVLDVTEAEPLPVSSPLWGMPNVILTQHTGGGNKFEDEGKVKLFIINLTRFVNGEPVLNTIDITRGY